MTAEEDAGGLRILVADDHPLFRAALVHTLQAFTASGGALFEASSFASLVSTVTAQPELDLVLLDLNMPGAQGFSSLVYLRGERPALPVIVISSNDQPRTVSRAQEFGAAGFVPKSAPIAVLQNALRQVMAGGEWFPQDKATRSAEDAQFAEQLAQLTPQQFRVLMCIADGLLNKQIAYELGLAENTVKVHISAILRKLDCNSRTQAAVKVKALQPEGEGSGG
ncbi:MAG: DNA-binding response regulator [Hydrocarboniphaga sp.]|uniref:response regulator n=1 Tax=Hydrocarboniphaga sp. TaxID=2033016 RepID=UPI00260B8F9C|nr:response regulator transcription factor [Hydrocarboniphaga sp.]MDB5972669.1 DNA-binding response regulator [Hydrocarboniphaga sp.]